MDDHLNIPLSDTRQYPWRVIGLVGSVLGVIATGWLLAHVPRILAAVPVTLPDADITVRIEKTGAAVQAARGPFLGTPVLEGAPWSLAEALAMSESELILAYANKEWVAIFDRALSPEEQSVAQTFGFQISSNDSYTALSASSSLALSGNNKGINLGLLRPNALATVAFGEHSATLRYNEQQQTLVASGVELFEKPLGGISIPPDQLLISAGIKPGHINGQVLPLILPGVTTLVTSLERFGGSFFLGKNGDRITYALSVTHDGNASYTAEDLTRLAHEFVMTSVVKEEISRLPDGTWFTELRAEDIAVDLREERGFSFVSATTTTDSVRIVSGPQTLAISNDQRPEQGEQTRASACGASSIAIVRPKGLLTDTGIKTTHYQPQGLSSVFSQSVALSQRQHEFRVCWE